MDPGNPSVAELFAGTGFGWLVIDAEHGLNGVRDVLAQQRAAGSDLGVLRADLTALRAAA